MTHSFPTRRSSDLPHQAPLENRMRWRGRFDDGYDAARERWHARQLDLGVIPPGTPLAPPNPGVPAWTDLTPNQKAFSARSEEHTSELQSLMRISYAVFCLKKKIKNKNQHTT